MTILAKLLASEEGTLGYITYVFECLDEEISKETRYIMCTRWPNWDHRKIEIDEVGFLNFMEIRAGVDKWFNGSQMIPYQYNNIQFIKFVSLPKKNPHKFVMQINLNFNSMTKNNYDINERKIDGSYRSKEQRP